MNNKTENNKNNKNNNLFVDKIFPPNSHSLYETNETFLNSQNNIIFEERVKNELIQWKRPSEFSDETYKLFQENIEPNDIKQVK